MDKMLEDEYNNLAINIAYYRDKRNMTQQALAMRANISRGYLSQIESEKADKWSSLDILFNIAKILNVPVYKLFMHRESENEVQ